MLTLPEILYTKEDLVITGSLSLCLQGYRDDFKDIDFSPIRAFRNPHHTATKSSILGGTNSKMGEVALSNNGVLFFDDLPHFPNNILEATASAICLMGLAGELAFEKIVEGHGNSTYRNKIIDTIYNATGDILDLGAKYEIK